MTDATKIQDFLAGLPAVKGVSKQEGNIAFKSESPTSDLAELTTEIKRGSETHFALFYQEFSPRIYKFLLLLTNGNEEVSRDLHQEVMVRAATKMETFNSEGRLWGWLSQVARNCWIDHLRKTNRRELRESAETPKDNELASSAGTGEHRFLELLEANMKLLSEQERELVDLFYFRDECHKSIAERTGRTVKAVESELARIRRKLKRFLLKRLK